MKFFFLAILLFCLAPLRAQPAPFLEGVVLDPKGAPLGDATVYLSSKMENPETYYSAGSFVTDARGRFFFADVMPGNYNFYVYHAGVADIPRPVVVVPGKLLSVSTIECARVPIKFLTPDGALLKNQVVNMLGSSLEGQNGIGGKRTTDNNGVALFDEMRLGVFKMTLVAKSCNGYAFIDRAETKPGLNAPLEVQLKAGGALRVVVQEKDAKGAGRFVGGVLVEPAGWPFSYLTRPEQTQPGVTADTTGAIEFRGLPTGTYNVSANTSGVMSGPLSSAMKISTSTVEIRAGETTTAHLDCAPLNAQQMNIRLLDKRGKPIANADLQMGLVPTGNAVTHFGSLVGPRFARTDANGKFSLYPVQKGRWALTVRDQSFDVTVTDKGALTTLTLN